MPIASIVADANVLLSAVVGKAALRVFTKFTIMVHVAQFNADEVAEYLPYMASKYELPIELVEMQWKLLPLRIHLTEEYHSQLPQAIADLKDRDPEDAHALALARSLTLPLWSNDRDLRGLDVACYPTARLLRLLAEEAGLSM
ncbi:MAG: PIN domain nuclease [Deltaproteobacteria bacterium]|nr:PIN domain nuclease [Deltaproteobacteria bacterium]